MHERETLDRRKFTLAAALLVLGGVTITVSGCGGGGGSPGSPSNPSPSLGPGDKAGTISANHGHTAVITAAQLTAAGAVALDIRGNSDYPHTVSLSSADVAAIAANQRVSRESSNDDGHTHTVTFN